MSKRKALSKFTILCWAAFTAIPGRGLDSPDCINQTPLFSGFCLQGRDWREEAKVWEFIYLFLLSGSGLAGAVFF